MESPDFLPQIRISDPASTSCDSGFYDATSLCDDEEYMYPENAQTQNLTVQSVRGATTNTQRKSPEASLFETAPDPVLPLDDDINDRERWLSESAEPGGNKMSETTSHDDIGKEIALGKDPTQLSSSTTSPPDAVISIEESRSTTQSPHADLDIKQWIHGARAADHMLYSTPFVLDTIANTSSPLAVLSKAESTEATPILRPCLLELLDVLHVRDHDSENEDERDSQDEQAYTDVCSSADAVTPDSAGAAGDANDEARSSSSPKTSTTSGNASGGSQNLKRSYQQERETSDWQDNDDEPPSKKPNRGSGQAVAEDKYSPNELLMPCPLLESQKCLGTNPTISELLRCLGTNHQIIICIECLTLLDESRPGKRAEEVLNDHKGSDDCVRRCVGESCAGNASSYHLRTSKCPSLRKIPNELWRFIWKLLNPGQEAPSLQFSTGIGCLHDKVRRPRTRRTNERSRRNRAQEIVQEIEEDLEAKERRIRILENELKAANDRSHHAQREHELRLQQSQQQHDHSLQERTQKVSEQEEIILDLLERLIKSGRHLEPSLQKRLNRVCPNVLQEALDTAKIIPSNMPPTPDSIPKKTPLATPSKSPSLRETLHHEHNFTPRNEALEKVQKFSLEWANQANMNMGELFEVGQDFNLDDFLHYNDGQMSHGLHSGSSGGML